MSRRYLGWLLIGSLVLASTLTSHAASQGDVTAELAAFKVLVKPNGKEVMEPTERVQPGDVVEYRAVYRNRGKKPVKEVLATLPIPAGMAYQPNTAGPAVVHASVDGQTFAPVPLRRQIRLADGRMETQEVPYAEYRFLRWDLESLAVGKDKTVRARVQVNTVGAPAGQAKR